MSDRRAAHYATRRVTNRTRRAEVPTPLDMFQSERRTARREV